VILFLNKISVPHRFLYEKAISSAVLSGLLEKNSFSGFSHPYNIPYSISLNSLIVMESVSKIALNVSLKVRLSHKCCFSIFAQVVVELCKNQTIISGKT